MGDAGANALAKALETHTTLETLDLGANDNITDHGAIKIAESLLKNNNLIFIHLGCPKVTTACIPHFIEALQKNNTSLTCLWGNNDIFSKNEALGKLLQRNKSITAMLSQLGNPELAELDLSSKGIGDLEAKAIADKLKINRVLTHLDLSSNDIGVEGAKEIAEALKVNRSLTRLNLTHNRRIGNDGAKAIANILKNNISVLTELFLNQNEIGLEGARAIAEAIKVNSTLTYLNLWENKIDDEGAIVIATALETNVALTSLILNNNKIGIRGIKALAATLEKNYTMTYLNIIDKNDPNVSEEIKELVRKIDRLIDRNKAEYQLRRGVNAVVEKGDSKKIEKLIDKDIDEELQRQPQKVLPLRATVKNSSAKEKIKVFNVGNSPAKAHVDNTKAQNITAASLKQTIPARSNNSNNATSPANIPRPLSSPSTPSASVSHTKVGGNLNVTSKVKNIQPVATVSNAQVTGDVHVSSHLHIEQKLSYSPEEKRIVSQQRLEDALQQLRIYRLKNETLQAELATYVPIQGANSFEDNKLFDVKTAVNNFLKSNKKVLLLQGYSGIGKTLLCRVLEKHLLENYDNSKPVPIFISLPSLHDPIKNAIEEHFSQQGFKPQQVAQLKKEHSFIFILDGYDEIAKHKPNNLYRSNELSNWNAKVIISCRSQYLLAKREVYLDRFLPDYQDQPEPGLFQEIVLKPFTPEQIKIYLQKFVEVEKPLWQDWRIYLKHIETIPGLKDLIETPFILRIAVEVLPVIAERSNDESDASISRLDLYDAFAQRWFRRQASKLDINSEDRDIKSEFKDFSERLAKKMLQLGINEVIIETDAKNRANAWDEFFGNDPDLRLIRSGCPLKKLGDNRFAFIHESLLEYFGDREKFSQSMTPHAKPLMKEKGLPKTLPVKQIQALVVHPVIRQSQVFQKPSIEEIDLTLEQLSITNIVKVLKQYPNLKSIGIPKQEFVVQSEKLLSHTPALSSYTLKGRLISKDRFVLFQAILYADNYSNGEKGYNIQLAIHRIKDGALINSFSYKHVISYANLYASYTSPGNIESLDIIDLDQDQLAVCYAHANETGKSASINFCLFDVSTGKLLGERRLPREPELKITSFMEENDRLYINRSFYIDNFVDFVTAGRILKGFPELSRSYLRQWKMGDCLPGFLVDILDSVRVIVLQNNLLSVFDTKDKKHISSIKVPYQEKMEFQYVNSHLFLYSRSDLKDGGKCTDGYLIEIEVNQDGQLKNNGEKKLTNELLSYFSNSKNTLLASKSNYCILFGSQNQSGHHNYVFLFDPRTQNFIFSLNDLYDRCLLALPISDKQIAIIIHNSKQLKFSTYNLTDKVIKCSLDFRSLLRDECEVKLIYETNQLMFQLKNASVLSIEEKEKYLSCLKLFGDFISAALGLGKRADLWHIRVDDSKRGILVFCMDPDLFLNVTEILNALAGKELIAKESFITTTLKMS